MQRACSPKRSTNPAVEHIDSILCISCLCLQQVVGHHREVQRVAFVIDEVVIRDGLPTGETQI